MPLDKLLGSVGESVGFYSSGDTIIESMWEPYAPEQFQTGAVVGALVRLEAQDGTRRSLSAWMGWRVDQWVAGVRSRLC